MLAYFLHMNGGGITKIKEKGLLKTIDWALQNLFENDIFAPKD